MSRILAALAVLLACGTAATCLADTVSDPVTITPLLSGSGKVMLQLQAGPSGAPDGFALWWMTRTDFIANGSQWGSAPPPATDFATFNGTPTLNTSNGTITSFLLAPNQKILVEVGDLVDETGVAANEPGELNYGDQYVITGFSIAGTGHSELAPTVQTETKTPTDCAFTQGYWKNHPGAWPVGSLTLGTVTYSKTQLLAILGQPAVGNGLISLAKQLIATKLNLLNGAQGLVIAYTVTSADQLIGNLVPAPVGTGFIDPSLTSPLTERLDSFNNEMEANQQCGGSTPAKPTSWGTLKTRYR